MKILALDFSSPQRSVALVGRARSTDALIEHEVIEAGSDSSRPLEMIEEVLKQTGNDREQVERLAVGLGPGSYTGIRASIALAQGWQLGLGTPLQGLSSADGVAAQAHAEGLTGRVVVVLDAQRGEFYRAVYELDSAGWRGADPLRLASRDLICEHARAGDRLVGPEVLKWFPEGKTIYPRAAILGRLAMDQTSFTPGEQLQPIYLRPTAFVKAPPPRVLPD
jgi:tRNA threonylcarbamoyladenosine biosynthesis protein TsaB